MGIKFVDIANYIKLDSVMMISHSRIKVGIANLVDMGSIRRHSILSRHGHLYNRADTLAHVQYSLLAARNCVYNFTRKLM